MQFGIVCVQFVYTKSYAEIEHTHTHTQHTNIPTKAAKMHHLKPVKSIKLSSAPIPPLQVTLLKHQ